MRRSRIVTGICTFISLPDKIKASKFSKYLYSTPAFENIKNSSPKIWSMAPTRIQNSVATRKVFIETHSPSWNSRMTASMFCLSRFFIRSRSNYQRFSTESGRPAKPTILPLKTSSAARRTLSHSFGFVLSTKSRYSSQWMSVR